MTLAVLDASVFVSAISPVEVHHERATSLMDSVPEHRPFLVPAIFALEVMAALARRKESPSFLDTVATTINGPRFHLCPLDAMLLREATEVTRRARCRAYDAVYAALALRHRAVLLTLDEELQRLLGLAYPDEIRFS